MPTRRVPLTLAVALIATAALGPPVAAAPAEGGGTAAAPGTADGGGAAFGEPAPEPRAKKKRRGRSAAKPERKPAAAPGQHHFPIAGPFSWGGPDAQFGAKRKGHRHQGYDLAAAKGTPLVAPYAGTVEFVGYQARGAGHYLVLDGDGEDYDYVFMHLRSGSTLVTRGQRVAAGQQLAEVGSTGGSSGPHLHFEIWVGGWYTGGHPIDPLPLLQTWSGV